MIEIAFDKNDNNEFLNQTRPVIEIRDVCPHSFPDYYDFAAEILNKYCQEQIIIIRNDCPSFSSNLFAVALFVQSCLMSVKTECVVFKVKEYEKSLQSYKPYVALTIALKYAIRLYNLSMAKAYREIAGMSYLGIKIKRDYENNQLILTLNEGNEKTEFEAMNMEQAIVAVACLKAYSLLKIKDGFRAKIAICEQPTDVNINQVVYQIVQNVVRFVDRVE